MMIGERLSNDARVVEGPFYVAPGQWEAILR
jgi:hypothetical protein